MKKWNMIIDVAECTNCNLCTLATMDEYVGNEFPGYSKPMPRHGHKWINILQKERGQVPMIDIAYVPTMCNHCDDPPCMKNAGDAIKIIGFSLEYPDSSATSVGHLDMQDSGPATIEAISLNANVPLVYDIDGGATNVFSGNPIVATKASHNNTSNPATLKICSLEDSTP